MENKSNLWKVSVVVKKEDLNIVENCLTSSLEGDSCWIDGSAEIVFAATSYSISNEVDLGNNDWWGIEIFCKKKPLIEALELPLKNLGISGIALKPQIQQIPCQDWLLLCQSNLRATKAGRFYIRPSHEKLKLGKRSNNLLVNAGPAFGSGTHESTFGCLLAIDKLAKRSRIQNPLDIGSGSGILTMAIARAWHCDVLGVDLDARSIAFARDMVQLNNLQRQVKLLVNNGCKKVRINKRQPFDLIVANILADPLISMAGEIRGSISNGGSIILSGLLRKQEKKVLASYRYHKFLLKEKIRINDWSTIIMSYPTTKSTNSPPAI